MKQWWNNLKNDDRAKVIVFGPSFIVIILVFLSCLVSCNTERHYNTENQLPTTSVVSEVIVMEDYIAPGNYGSHIARIVIDNCEYILYYGTQEKAITHHANCHNILHR